MTKIRIALLLLLAQLVWPSETFAACRRFFDPGCNIRRSVDKAARVVGKPIEKAQHDTGHTIEKAAQDSGRVSEKSGQESSAALKNSLTPTREYLPARDIPPSGVGAYGLVALHAKPTTANQKKLAMVCKSFIAYFPRSKTSLASLSDQMLTIWPLDEPEAERAKTDDCEFVLEHYDLDASAAAMNDARIQNATFDGEGPYLIGWSPANSRGFADKLVLVVDMSADNSQISIDRKFLFWKNKIVENPTLWRGGWSLEDIRVAIKEFSDRYGEDMLTAIKLIGVTKR
jgi:hypothetical protein